MLVAVIWELVKQAQIKKSQEEDYEKDYDAFLRNMGVMRARIILNYL